VKGIGVRQKYAERVKPFFSIFGKKKMNPETSEPDDSELTDGFFTPDGERLTVDQLAKRLDEAAEQPRISFEEFKRWLEQLD
jgi:hypothetical protein